MSHRADRNSPAAQLWKAVSQGDNVALTKLLSSGDKDMVTMINQCDQTPLHIAARDGNVESIEVLLNAGASSALDTRDKFGLTPLHLAASFGRSEAVKMLLGRGADIEEKNKGGGTALHLAAQRGYVDVVRVLLRSGANQAAVNESGQTPQDMSLNDDVRQVFLVHEEEAADQQQRVARKGATEPLSSSLPRTPPLNRKSSDATAKATPAGGRASHDGSELSTSPQLEAQVLVREQPPESSPGMGAGGANVSMGPQAGVDGGYSFSDDLSVSVDLKDLNLQQQLPPSQLHQPPPRPQPTMHAQRPHSAPGAHTLQSMPSLPQQQVPDPLSEDGYPGNVTGRMSMGGPMYGHHAQGMGVPGPHMAGMAQSGFMGGQVPGMYAGMGKPMGADGPADGGGGYRMMGSGGSGGYGSGRVDWGGAAMGQDMGGGAGGGNVHRSSSFGPSNAMSPAMSTAVAEEVHKGLKMFQIEMALSQKQPLNMLIAPDRVHDPLDDVHDLLLHYLDRYTLAGLKVDSIRADMGAAVAERASGTVKGRVRSFKMYAAAYETLLNS
eukprot:jgi/Mesvir1/22752/Mv14152-RA.1